MICAQAGIHLQTHGLGSRLTLLEVEFLTCRRGQALGTEPGGECPWEFWLNQDGKELRGM